MEENGRGKERKGLGWMWEVLLLPDAAGVVYCCSLFMLWSLAVGVQEAY